MIIDFKKIDSNSISSHIGDDASELQDDDESVQDAPTNSRIISTSKRSSLPSHIVAFQKYGFPVKYVFREDTYAIPSGEVTLQNFIIKLLAGAQTYNVTATVYWLDKLGPRNTTNNLEFTEGKDPATIYQEWCDRHNLSFTKCNSIVHIIFSLLESSSNKEREIQPLLTTHTDLFKRQSKESFHSFYNRVLTLLQNTSYCTINWELLQTICKEEFNRDAHLLEHVKKLEEERK